MLYRLYISYKDCCWGEKIIINDTDPLHLYEEMKRTHVYETHWDINHASSYGEFPFGSESLLFPSFEQFQHILDSLIVGQTKYAINSKQIMCSYYCGLKRIF